MKTKMLFSAAMVASLLAACTNDDFVSSSQSYDVSTQGRVTVGDVTLNFVKGTGDEADTRLSFDPNTGYWSWEETDVIGALLMDDVWGTSNGYKPYENPEEWAGLTWLQKYTLSDDIYTDYPFTYNTETGAWESAGGAQMLEGNYFFAYPFDSYSGRRQMIYYLNGQPQTDGSQEAMLDAFSHNQLWVGYAQVKEQNSDNYNEMVTNVYMTHVLAPIQLAIYNTGTQTRNITKIQIKGTRLTSAVTIDPTDAEYKGENGLGMYNLDNSVQNANITNGTTFNYANFLGSPSDEGDADMQSELYVAGGEDYVWNIDTESNYVKGDALRAVVNPIEVAGVENYCEVSLESPQEVKTGETAYFNIYVTPMGTVGASDDLILTIYTSDGVVKDIDLTQVNEEIDQNKGITATTDKAIVELAPTTSNAVRVQLDDNSFSATDAFDINNEDDLLQFIQWNSTKDRPYTATLLNDVTLTKEMADMLVAIQQTYSSNKLIVVSDSKKLTLEANVEDGDLLDYIDVSGVDVVLDNSFSINSDNVMALPAGNKSLTVSENGTLTVEKYSGDNLKVINYGSLEIPEGATATNIELTNYADVTIEGTMTPASGSTNQADGTITISETGILRGTSSVNLANSGTVDNSKGGDFYNMTNADEGVVITGTGVNHFNNTANATTIRLTSLSDEITGSHDYGYIEYNAEGEDILASALVTAGVTHLNMEGGVLMANGNNTAVNTVLQEVTINGGTIGGYDTAGASSTWAALGMADNAKVYLSGGATLSNVRIAADVYVLDGTLTISSKVVLATSTSSDTYLTTGKTLTLGSVDGFTVNNVSMSVPSGSSFLAKSIVAATGTTAQISNIGGITLDEEIDSTTIDVDGNAIVTTE